MKTYKHIFFVLITIFLTLFQIGATRSISNRAIITLPIIVLLLYVVFWGVKFAIIHASISGFILDMYSPLPFGLHILVLLLLVLLGFTLIKSLLSQKSILPLFSLTLFSTLFFYLALHTTEYISNTIKGGIHATFFSLPFFFWIFVCALLNGIVISIIYKIFSLRKTFKLRPYIVN